MGSVCLCLRNSHFCRHCSTSCVIVDSNYAFDVYWQVPFYKGEHIKFDVMPNQMPLTVEHDSVVIAVTEDCSL